MGAGEGAECYWYLGGLGGGFDVDGVGREGRGEDLGGGAVVVERGFEAVERLLQRLGGRALLWIRRSRRSSQGLIRGFQRVRRDANLRRHSRKRVLIPRIEQALQLIAVAPALVPRARVDRKRKQDRKPHYAVERGDSEEIPGRGDPAPEEGGAVDAAAGGVSDEEVGEGGDEGEAVAQGEVGVFEPAEAGGWPGPEEGEVHVYGHAEGPEDVDAEEELDRWEEGGC